MWNGKDGVFDALASLRVYGDGLRPDEVTLQLALPPFKSDVQKRMGMWVYSTRGLVDRFLPLERHLGHIVQILRPRQEALVQLQQRYKTDVLCYFASQSDIGGFDLSPEVMTALGALRLTLRTDEYFCCDQTEAEQGAGGNRPQRGG
jgi:hypothetical protein